MRIGDLAGLLEEAGVGVNVDTLRELVSDLGLGSRRSPASHRRFTDADARLLVRVLSLWRRSAKPLGEVVEALKAGSDEIGRMRDEELVALVRWWSEALDLSRELEAR